MTFTLGYIENVNNEAAGTQASIFQQKCKSELNYDPLFTETTEPVLSKEGPRHLLCDCNW